MMDGSAAWAGMVVGSWVGVFQRTSRAIDPVPVAASAMAIATWSM